MVAEWLKRRYLKWKFGKTCFSKLTRSPDKFLSYFVIVQDFIVILDDVTPAKMDPWT